MRAERSAFVWTDSDMSGLESRNAKVNTCAAALLPCMFICMFMFICMGMLMSIFRSFSN